MKKELKKQRMKTNKGITLIALVITIIVLLILAGVSIATLTGDNGVLNQANTAKERTTREEVKEQAKVDIIGWQTDKFSKGEDATLSDAIVKGIINGKDYVGTLGDTSFTTKDGKYEIDYSELYGNGNSNGSGNGGSSIGEGETAVGGNKEYVSNGKTAIIPEGFTVSKISEETSIDEGLVIYHIPQGGEGVDWTKETDGILDVQANYDQFVWVPVDKATFDTKFKRTEGYRSGSLEGKIGNCGEAGVDGENAKVTEDNTTKDEAKLMYASVEQNGGFYIARYEAGREGEKVVSKRNATVYNYIKWGNSMTDSTGGAVDKARGMDTANGYKGVTSTLCYGVQWDAALNFIDPNYITNEIEGKPNCNSSSYLVNSAGKGWYNDNYSSGNAEHKTGIDVDAQASNKKNNIYDMAGNMNEWTMESYSTGGRVNRGGYYYRAGSYEPASGRNNSSPTSSSEDSISFRPTLFLKD